MSAVRLRLLAASGERVLCLCRCPRPCVCLSATGGRWRWRTRRSLRPKHRRGRHVDLGCEEVQKHVDRGSTSRRRRPSRNRRRRAPWEQPCERPLRWPLGDGQKGVATKGVQRKRRTPSEIYLLVLFANRWKYLEIIGDVVWKLLDFLCNGLKYLEKFENHWKPWISNSSKHCLHVTDEWVRFRCHGYGMKLFAWDSVLRTPLVATPSCPSMSHAAYGTDRLGIKTPGLSPDRRSENCRLHRRRSAGRHVLHVVWATDLG